LFFFNVKIQYWFTFSKTKPIIFVLVLVIFGYLVSGAGTVAVAFLLFLLQRVATIFGARVLKPHLLAEIQPIKIASSG